MKKNKYSHIIGVFLVLLAAVLPYVNNFISIIYPRINEIKDVGFFNDLGTVIWMYGDSVSALLLIISFFYNVAKWLYVFPIISILISFVAITLNSMDIAYISGDMQYVWFIVLFSIAFVFSLKKINNYIKSDKE